MDASLTNRSAPGALLILARGLVAAAGTLHAIARALDAWLAARDKAREDRATLAAMSERELADIGLSAGYRGEPVNARWTGDATR